MKKILFIILLFTFITSISAESLVYTGIDNVYYAQNGLPAWYKSSILSIYKIDGQVAYCIEPFVSGLGATYDAQPISSLNIDDETLNYIERVGYYGYEYPGHNTKEYLMAAQELIWEKLTGYEVDYFTKQYSYGTRYNIEYQKNEILRLINKEEEIELKEVIINVKEEKVIELNADLEIVNDKGLNIHIEDQKLYIEPIDEVNEKIIVLKNKAYDNGQSFVYRSSGNQTLMKTRITNSKTYELKINVLGGKVSFLKTDYLGRALANVKIGFYNEDGSTYYNGYTDKDGKIVLDNIPYGNYYIKEEQALDGYLLSDEIIEFTVDSNEEVFLTMQNYEEIEVPNTGIYSLFYRKERTIIRDYEAIVSIPKINLQNRLYNITDDRNDVNKNVYVLPSSDMPDIDDGNLILASHSGSSDIAYFKNLNQLQKGDKVYIIYNHKKYEYLITNIYKQDKVGKIRIKRNYDKQTLTLITCDKYDDTKQIVYIAEI